MSSETGAIGFPYLAAAEELRPNAGQWAAYESTGDCVILAGPGSGKTKTLTVKMARILSEDVHPPQGIACITYSNQCARELIRRLEALGVEARANVFIGTVHSFCLRHVVIPFGHLAGGPPTGDITVASQAEREGEFASALRHVVGQNENPRDWTMRCERYRRVHLDRTVKAWRDRDEQASQVIEAYEAGLAKRGLIDFDGIVLEGQRLIRDHCWVQKALVARFPVLVIDEYQDLGVALHEMVKRLRSDAGARIVAVGDADQSIYGFTGAVPALLKDLSEQEGIEKIALTLNYRSGSRIVQASEVTLQEARGFMSHRGDVGELYFHHYKGGLAEQVQKVVDEIIPAALKRGKDRTLGSVAVLYRDKFDGEVIAKAVEHQGWKFIRLDNGNHYPRTPLILWLEDCAAWCSGGWRSGVPRLSGILRAWMIFRRSIASEADERLERLKLVRCLYKHRNQEATAREWLSGIRKSVVDAALSEERTLRDEMDSMKKLDAALAESGPLADFTVGYFGAQAGSPDHLKLMTLHAAKGLEFDVVIMIGLEQGRLPYDTSSDASRKAEDRRLFYVGITRAEEEVHLLCSGWFQTKHRTKRLGVSEFVLELQRWAKDRETGRQP